MENGHIPNTLHTPDTIYAKMKILVGICECIVDEQQDTVAKKSLTTTDKRILLNCFSLFCDLHLRTALRATQSFLIWFWTVANSLIPTYISNVRGKLPFHLVVVTICQFRSFIGQHFWSVVWWQEVYRLIHITYYMYYVYIEVLHHKRLRRFSMLLLLLLKKLKIDQLRWVNEWVSSTLLHLCSRINCVWQKQNSPNAPFHLWLMNEILPDIHTQPLWYGHTS